MSDQIEVVGTELEAPVEVTEFEQTSPLTADDVFSTNPLPVPPAIPDAHRATITSVEAKHYDNDKETVSFVVNLRSLDIPTLDAKFEIFLPKLFAENIKVDPNTLPDELGNKQRTVYRMHVASEDGRATMQKLRTLAELGGRTIHNVGIARRSTNIDEYAENHSKMLTGLEVVFYRAPDKSGDPVFSNRLRVKGILSFDVADKPKQLRNYKKMWLPEA
jgi:hypothetical protein